MEHDADPRALERMGLGLAMIAHEVRNHLAPIRMQCELALRDQSLPIPARAALTSASSRTAAAAEAMDTLLALATASKAASTQHVDLIQAIDDCVRSTVAQHDAQITVDVPRGTMTAMPIQALHLALTNLLRNALEACLHARVAVRCAVNTNTVYLRITDNGPGIQDATARDTFRAFQRSSTGGHGLGLAIAALVLRAHDADIQLESTGSNGTTWLLTLPIASTSSASKAA